MASRQESSSAKLAITIDEAAELLGIGRSLAYTAARDGSLPTVRIGRRLLVPVRKLERLLDTSGGDTASGSAT